MFFPAIFFWLTSLHLRTATKDSEVCPAHPTAGATFACPLLHYCCSFPRLVLDTVTLLMCFLGSPFVSPAKMSACQGPDLSFGFPRTWHCTWHIVEVLIILYNCKQCVQPSEVYLSLLNSILSTFLRRPQNCHSSQLPTAFLSFSPKWDLALFPGSSPNTNFALTIFVQIARDFFSDIVPKLFKSRIWLFWRHMPLTTRQLFRKIILSNVFKFFYSPTSIGCFRFYLFCLF